MPTTQSLARLDRGTHRMDPKPQRLSPEAVERATLIHDLNHFLAAALAHVDVDVAGEEPAVSGAGADLVAIREALTSAAALVRVLARSLSGGERPAKRYAQEVERCFHEVARILSLPGEASVSVRLPIRGVVLELADVELKQVLMNLATNAIEAGARSVVLSLEAPHPAGPAVLRVEDDGPGIPESVRARLFEPFFTTKDMHQGLGLSGVRAAVERHGGTIAVESSEGLGSVFTLRFPTTRAAGRVLIVDEDPLSARLTARLLGRAGYQTVIAGHTEDALRQLELEGDGFDLALVDVGFGLEPARKLVAELQAALSHVIVTSSRAIDWGGSAPFLERPFSAQDLTETVRGELERGGAARSNVSGVSTRLGCASARSGHRRP
jgi:CheY-like chemotaxis protein